MIDKNFCSLAWQDVTIMLAQRTLKHCCRAIPEKFPDILTPDFIDNNQQIAERRKFMMAGNRHYTCAKCWKEEDETGTSYRIIRGEHSLNKKIKENPKKSFIKNIGIQFDNICDQSCIYCFPSTSSIIAKERGVDNRLKSYIDKDLDAVILWIENLYKKSKDKKSIRIYGGEPTASKSWYNFLDKLLTTSLVQEDLQFHIITNCNMSHETRKKINMYMEKSPPNWIWSWAVSNESTGKISENVRYYSNWNRWCENFEFFVTNPYISSLMIAPSPNIFTVKDLPNFIKYILDTVENKNIDRHITFNSNWINDPEILDCVYLPESHKKYVKKTIEIVSNSKAKFNKQNVIHWLTELEKKIGKKECNHEKLKKWLDQENLYKNNKLDTELLLKQII